MLCACLLAPVLLAPRAAQAETVYPDFGAGKPATETKASSAGRDFESDFEAVFAPASPESGEKPVPGHERIVQLAQAQALLNILGYDTGTVDGVYGSRTERAVRAFERDAGWPETGDVTRRLITELRTLTARAIESASAASAIPGGAVPKGGILRQSNGEPYSPPGDAAVAYRVEQPDPLPAAASIANVETALPEPGTCFLDQPGALEDVNLFSTWRAVLSAAIDACGSGGKQKGRRELQSFLAPLTPALLARAEAAYDERYLVWMQDDADPSYTRCDETLAYQNAIEGLRERTELYKRRVEEHMRHLCRPEDQAAPGPGEPRKDSPSESWLDPTHRESTVPRGIQLSKADAVVTTRERNPDS